MCSNHDSQGPGRGPTCNKGLKIMVEISRKQHLKFLPINRRAIIYENGITLQRKLQSIKHLIIFLCTYM